MLAKTLHTALRQARGTSGAVSQIIYPPDFWRSFTVRRFASDDHSMKHYLGFIVTGQTFQQRTGLPNEFSSAFGRIALSFSDLEHQLSLAVAKLLKLDSRKAEILTAEMSFKNKVHLMASLILNLESTHNFNSGDAPLTEVLDELVACCFKAEELRCGEWVPTGIVWWALSLPFLSRSSDGKFTNVVLLVRNRKS